MSARGAVFAVCAALALVVATWVSYTAGHRKGAFEERLKCLGEANE